MAGDAAVVASRRDAARDRRTRTRTTTVARWSIGPDGDLYIGTGDGGGGGDPDGNGQNLGVLLGKILRIDPTPSASLPYTIPADNPFVGQAGARGEIWMYGLRNPWRFTFDRSTGDLWIADVGQGLYEEVDRAAAGVEGHELGLEPARGLPLLRRCAAARWSGPARRGVARRRVVRGDRRVRVPRHRDRRTSSGAYVYADLCRSELSAVVQSGGTVTAQAEFPVGLSQPTTFGEDPAGELWVADLGGTVSKLVTPPPPSVSVGDKAILEGDTGTRSVTFPVTLSEPGTHERDRALRRDRRRRHRWHQARRWRRLQDEVRHRHVPGQRIGIHADRQDRDGPGLRRPRRRARRGAARHAVGADRWLHARPRRSASARC